MFIKFQQIRGGSIYIRAEDWRDMNDLVTDEGELARCMISYIPQGSTELIRFRAAGSADENYERIRNAEMQAAIEYERAQRAANERQARGLPAIPVQRGRQGGGA